MDIEKNEVVTTADEVLMGDVEDEYILTLSRPYNFEGKVVERISFAGLEDVTAKDMCRANKALIGLNDFQIMPENSLHYALIIASECTDYPIEFYDQLRARDAMKVKNMVTNFFFGGE